MKSTENYQILREINNLQKFSLSIMSMMILSMKITLFVTLTVSKLEIGGSLERINPQ